MSQYIVTSMLPPFFALIMTLTYDFEACYIFHYGSFVLVSHLCGKRWGAGGLSHFTLFTLIGTEQCTVFNIQCTANSIQCTV